MELKGVQSRSASVGVGNLLTLPSPPASDTVSPASASMNTSSNNSSNQGILTYTPTWWAMSTTPPSWSGHNPLFPHGVQSKSASVGIGNLLTPPSHSASDTVSPISASMNSSSNNSSNQGILTYTPTWWATSTTPGGFHTGFTPPSWSEHNPLFPPRSIFSPSSQPFMRNNNTSSTSGESPSLPPPPYDLGSLPPFQHHLSMSGSPNIPTTSHQQQNVVHALMNPPHGMPRDSTNQKLPPTPTMYGGSQPSSAPQQSLFSYSGYSASALDSRISPPVSQPSGSHDHAQSHFVRPPYLSYSLPPMPGPVMTNINSPNSQMTMAGSMQQSMIPPGYNSGFVTNAQSLYGSQPPQASQPANVERPFKCDQCPQSFNRNHYLKWRKRIHLAVKPFPCNHCDKSFSRTPPQRSTCGFCKRVFEGPNGWDERMEHVSKHFEGKHDGVTDVANFQEEEDEDLRDWAVREGIVRDYGTRGFWLVGMEPLSSPSMTTKILTSPSMSTPSLAPLQSAESSSTQSSVNGESITSSLSALVNAVVLVQRLNRTRRSKLDEAASPPVNRVPAAASRPSLRDTLETQSGGGINMELWLSQSRESLSSSPETDSVDSFEDDSPEDNSGDEDRTATIGCWSTSEGLSSENMLSMLRPLFATLSDEISQPLTCDLTLLFDCWATRGSLERPSHPPSSSSSTPPRSQANGSPGSSTNHNSSSGSEKKRPLRDGSESPGDGDDDKNGDETRKRLKLNSQSQKDIALRWACPFYQRSPHHYCVETEYGDYRKCAKSPGFSGVHRVKDHIYKCHALIYCDRCYSVFKNEDDLTAHRRDPSPCNVQDPRPMQGLTNEQKKLLKPRDRNKSEEARWNNMYRICFPNDEFIPSPYYIFYSRETAELRRDVFDIVEEETRSLDDTVRDRIRERLQHAFNNVQMRSSLGIMGLPTPSSSEISSQQPGEAGPSPRSPLASRSAAVPSISQQAIPAVNAEPGHMAPTQDPPLGELQGSDADAHRLFDSMIEYPADEFGDGMFSPLSALQSCETVLDPTRSMPGGFG